jgi:hypothetical protein
MTYEATNTSASLRTIFRIALAVSLIVIASGFGGQTAAQELSQRKTLNRLAQQGGNDAASVLFRGGRDLITDQQWAKAEEQFSQYVSGYPSEKSVDAALYWIAYSQYKLTKFDKCKSTITRLLEKYKNTSWKEDARVLLAQLPGGGSGGVTVVGYGTDSDTVSYAAAAAATAEAYRTLTSVRASSGSGFGYGTGLGTGSQPPDDDPCEFKIVVLQALFQSDVQRGILAATDWLKPGSTQTVRCKGAALTLLARNGGKAVTPVILGVAEHEPDLKLRARAISALGTTNDDSVIDPLRDFALNSQENDIVEAALYALGQHTGPRAVTVLGEIAMSGRPVGLRRIAISSIATRPGEPAVDILLKIYDADQSLEIRKAVVGGFAHRRSERAGNKLLEIARGADNIELRKAAISSIARRSGDQAIDILLGLYDTEKSEELKDQIINSLGYSNDQRITRKMIEIAKNTQSPMERRKRAIGWLSRSKDPEVLKFLEDLLK